MDYVDLINAWSMEAARRAMSHEQLATCAAQFTGMVIARSGLSPEGKKAMVEVCQGAVATAFANNTLNKDPSRARARGGA